MSDQIIYKYINSIKSYIQQLDTLYNFNSNAKITVDIDDNLYEFLSKTNLVSNFEDIIDINKLVNKYQTEVVNGDETKYFTYMSYDI